MDQRELVERAMRGDHDAFAVLAGRSVARLDAAARLILRDPELARDAVQEGFLAAWRNLPTLRDPDRFEAWLRRLVVRSCINTVRHRGRRPIEVELTPLHEPAISDIASIVADRELLDVALRRLRRRRAPSSSCTSISACPSRTSPSRSPSPSGPPSPACTAPSRRCAPRSMRISRPRREHVAGGQLA